MGKNFNAFFASECEKRHIDPYKVTELDKPEKLVRGYKVASLIYGKGVILATYSHWVSNRRFYTLIILFETNRRPVMYSNDGRSSILHSFDDLWGYTGEVTVDMNTCDYIKVHNNMRVLVRNSRDEYWKLRTLYGSEVVRGVRRFLCSDSGSGRRDTRLYNYCLPYADFRGFKDTKYNHPTIMCIQGSRSISKEVPVMHMEAVE